MTKKIIAVIMTAVMLISCLAGCESSVAEVSESASVEGAAKVISADVITFSGNTASRPLEADSASYSTGEFIGKISLNISEKPESPDGTEFICWSDVKLNGQPLNLFDSGSTSPYVTTESSDPDICMGLRIASLEHASPLAAQTAERIVFEAEVFGVETSESKVGTAEMTLHLTAEANFASGETSECEWTYVYYVENIE